MTTYSDEQLMASLIEEDNLNAFETLLSRYEKPLLIYIIRLIGGYQKAQDLYQETFYLIFKKRDTFDPTLRFSPWAYRIATNLCFKELKKKTNKLEIFLEDINQGESASPGSINKGIVNTPSNPSHEEKLIKRDLEDKVHDLIKSLPEKLLSVFILSTYQDLSHQEISKILDIPLGTGMIESAKKLEKGNLIFCILNINDIDYQSQFDLIISNATLHWVKDHRRLLVNCLQALKGNGWVRFNFAGDGNCQNFFRVVKEAMDDSRYRKYFGQFEWPWYMPTLGEYKNIVSKTGFSEVNLWEENADRYFPNKEAMIKWIDQPSIVPFLKHVSPEDKGSFRDFVIDRMVVKTKQEDGSCFETFRRVNLSSRK